MIRSACHLGHFPTLGGPGWTMVGQDGGRSIPLDEGRLFVFADTLLIAARPVAGSAPPPARRPPGRGHLSVLANTAARAQSPDLQQALASLDYFSDDDSVPREILPSSAEERSEGIRFWPHHGLMVNGVVYLYYLGIRVVTGTTWGFVNEGTGLATLDPATGECRRLDRHGSWIFWPPGTDDLHFGVQVLREGDVAYVFASRRGQRQSAGGPLATAQLSRVEVGRLSEPSAYHDLGDLGPCGSQFSVSFNRHLRQYLMTYVDILDGGLYLRVADAPWGPYSEPHRVAQVARKEEAYLGFEHASFAGENGRRIFISYCEPRFSQNSLVAVHLV